MFDFPTEISDLGTVPQQFQALYEENEEAFTLVKALSQKFEGQAFEDEIQSLKETNSALVKTVEDGRSQLEQKASLLDQKASLLDQKDRELSDLVKTSDQYLIESAASQAIGEAKGSIPLLLPHLRAALGVAEDAGKRIIQVFEGAGQPRRRENGEVFSVTDLVAEMKGSPIFARAFDGEDISGGGMNPSSGGPAQTKISRHDQTAVNARLEDIATGKISVS